MPGGSEVGAGGVGVVFDCPVAVVDLVVAGVAEQYEVVLLGGAAVLPFDDVVGDAPFGFGPTADAALVSGYEGGSELGAGVALEAEREALEVGVEDAGENLGVAGQIAELALGKRGAVGQAGVAELAVDGVVVGQDQQACGLGLFGIAVCGSGQQLGDGGRRAARGLRWRARPCRSCGSARRECAGR